ncbi:Uncharacterized protein DAT39_010902 [Clarias magur]|uniref:Uncharacterized protein n=1 Tax=Clarias magur TaxID=1594786 RepID=A0A8J4UGP2_CLAMG|nr:Uncharacterized protein DAT39_010902 [Clarias magur]
MSEQSFGGKVRFHSVQSIWPCPKKMKITLSLYAFRYAFSSSRSSHHCELAALTES